MLIFFSHKNSCSLAQKIISIMFFFSSCLHHSPMPWWNCRSSICIWVSKWRKIENIFTQFSQFPLCIAIHSHCYFEVFHPLECIARIFIFIQVFQSLWCIARNNKIIQVFQSCWCISRNILCYSSLSVLWMYCQFLPIQVISPIWCLARNKTFHSDVSSPLLYCYVLLFSGLHLQWTERVLPRPFFIPMSPLSRVVQ